VKNKCCSLPLAGSREQNAGGTLVVGGVVVAVVDAFCFFTRSFSPPQ